MKGKLLGVLVMAGLLSACSNQEISSGKVPSVVLNAISQQYPVKEEVEWKKIGPLYEAEIDLNDSVDLTVQVNEAGKVIMRKQDIAVAELPEAVRTAIRTRYPDDAIDDAERLEKDGLVFYQVELNSAGKKEKNLVFSVDGKEDKNTAFWD
jgi:hypothetical protein